MRVQIILGIMAMLILETDAKNLRCIEIFKGMSGAKICDSTKNGCIIISVNGTVEASCIKAKYSKNETAFVSAANYGGFSHQAVGCTKEFCNNENNIDLLAAELIKEIVNTAAAKLEKLAPYMEPNLKDVAPGMENKHEVNPFPGMNLIKESAKPAPGMEPNQKNLKCYNNNGASENCTGRCQIKRRIVNGNTQIERGCMIAGRKGFQNYGATLPAGLYGVRYAYEESNGVKEIIVSGYCSRDNCNKESEELDNILKEIIEQVDTAIEDSIFESENTASDVLALLYAHLLIIVILRILV